MATRYTEEFRRNATRIATTSGLTRAQIVSGLGVGISTLNKWVQKHQHNDPMSGPVYRSRSVPVSMTSASLKLGRALMRS